MGGKKPIGAMPSRGGVQRYGSSRVRSLAGNLTANHNTLGSAVSADESGPNPVYYSLFSGLNLAENGQPWIFKDETGEQRKEENKEEGESENDPKQRLIDIAENFVHTLYDAISTEMYAHAPSAMGGDASGVVGAPTEQSVLERLNSFAAALDTLTTQINRINQTLTILEKQIMTRTTAEDTQRLHERLSTLEGRQSAIQSKISQLDNIFGSSTGLWSRNVKKFQDFYERVTQNQPQSIPGSGPNSPRSQDSGPGMLGHDDPTQELHTGIRQLEDIWRSINDDREHYRQLESRLRSLERRLEHEHKSGSEDEGVAKELQTVQRQMKQLSDGIDDLANVSGVDAARYDSARKKAGRNRAGVSPDRDSGGGGGGDNGSAHTTPSRSSPTTTRMS